LAYAPGGIDEIIGGLAVAGSASMETRSVRAGKSIPGPIFAACWQEKLLDSRRSMF
jgi:hypothetical protein